MKGTFEIINKEQPLELRTSIKPKMPTTANSKIAIVDE